MSSSSDSSSSSEDEEPSKKSEASKDTEEKESRKRPASDKKDDGGDGEESDDSSDDGFVGPSMDMAAPAKKKKVLPYESVFLDNLPNAETYERSYMHRDAVNWCVCSGPTGFIITASIDGHVKFWKKREVGIEFVKHFRAHLGSVKFMTVNSTGTLLITVSDDKAGKVFDVKNFDMINILSLGFVPETACWIHQAGDAIPAVAIAGTAESPDIRIYDGRGSSDPIKVLSKIHMKPVSAIAYNSVADVVVSGDVGGMMEYWRGVKGDYAFPERKVTFESKLDTDLYEFAKNKTYPLSMTVSNNGKLLACYSADKKIRIFRFSTGKLSSVIDESLNHYFGIQQNKQLMPAMEFNRKVANEKDLEKSDLHRHVNVVFDGSSNFILYPTIIGIKLVNLVTHKNKVVIGKNENLRFINVCLSQNDEQNATTIPDMNMQVTEKTCETTITIFTLIHFQASDNPALSKDLLPDPTLICSAFKKNRLYLFTRRNGDHGDRDVFNEKPTHEDRIAVMEEAVAPKLFESATIHTNVGDIFVQLFPREVPKTIENFCGLAKNNYFNGCIFHRYESD